MPARARQAEVVRYLYDVSTTSMHGLSWRADLARYHSPVIAQLSLFGRRR
jgi:hypothetical protein